MKTLFTLIFFYVFTISYAQTRAVIVKDWTSYSQSVDVSNKEGKAFRISAYLKKGILKTNGKSALWARVDKKDHAVGFFQNGLYNEKVIVSGIWQRFEIEGIIDQNAADLYFGAFCQGNGDFYFDSFKLEIKNKKGEWETINISNANFENDSSGDLWNEGIRKNKKQKVKNFTIEYAKNNPYSLQYALHIEGAGIIGDNNGKYVKVNGVQLYYETYGQGEPLVMLHGNGQSIGAFMNQIDAFSKYYKVILVDCRGRGKSTFDNNSELTYTLQATDIKLFLDEINIDKAHILGWSDGGIIGLLMAINYPEKVDKLIAMGANIFPQGAYDLDGLLDSISSLEKTNTENKNDLIIALYKLMAYYPKLEYVDLNKISSETLIMAGDHDEIKNTHTIKIFEAIPHAQLAILPNETHYFPNENPEFFNELVLKFLK